MKRPDLTLEQIQDSDEIDDLVTEAFMDWFNKGDVSWRDVHTAAMQGLAEIIDWEEIHPDSIIGEYLYAIGNVYEAITMRGIASALGTSPEVIDELRWYRKPADTLEKGIAELREEHEYWLEHKETVVEVEP